MAHSPNSVEALHIFYVIVAHLPISNIYLQTRIRRLQK